MTSKQQQTVTKQRKVKGKKKIEKCTLDSWWEMTSSDIVRWTRLRQKDWEQRWKEDADLPVLFEFGVFNFCKLDNTFHTAIPCEFNERGDPIFPLLDKFPLHRDWILIPVEHIFLKELSQRNNASTVPCVNHAFLFVVDRKRKVSYSFDSHTDLELLTKESEMIGGQPLPPKGSKELGNLRRNHRQREELVKAARNSIVQRLVKQHYCRQQDVPYLGRVFLRPSGGGCSLALMRSIDLLLPGKIRPTCKEELQALQPLWRTLPSSGPFWDDTKLELGELRLEREAINLPLYVQYYKVGQRVTRQEQPQIQSVH